MYVSHIHVYHPLFPGAPATARGPARLKALKSNGIRKIISIRMISISKMANKCRGLYLASRITCTYILGVCTHYNDDDGTSTCCAHALGVAEGSKRLLTWVVCAICVHRDRWVVCAICVHPLKQQTLHTTPVGQKLQFF